MMKQGQSSMKEPSYKSLSYVFFLIILMLILSCIIIAITYAYFSFLGSNTSVTKTHAAKINEGPTISIYDNISLLLNLSNTSMEEAGEDITYYGTTTGTPSTSFMEVPLASIDAYNLEYIYNCTYTIDITTTGDFYTAYKNSSNTIAGEFVLTVGDNTYDFNTDTMPSSIIGTISDIDNDTTKYLNASILFKNRTGIDQSYLSNKTLGISLTVSDMKCVSVNQGIPNSYIEVKYLQSSGKQYIDTEVKVNSLSNVIIDTKYMKLDSSDTDVFGTSSISTNTILWNTTGSNSLAFYPRWGTIAGQASNFKYESPYSANIWGFTDAAHVLLLNGTSQNMIAYVDNIKVATYYYAAGIFSSSENILIFRGRNYSLAKWYWFKITNEDINILNLIPAIRKSDSKPGMYDTVTKTFFTNSGTGEFGYETLSGTYVSPQ